MDILNLYKKYLQQSVSPLTQAGYLRDIEEYLTWCRDSGDSVINSEHFLSYCHYLENIGYGIGTNRKKMKTVKRYIEFLRKMNNG